MGCVVSCAHLVRRFVDASKLVPAASACCVVLLLLSPAAAGTLVLFSNSDGLKAEAEFTRIDDTTLEVRLKNTSTGVPVGFGAGADQILTSISWDFIGTTTISGGSVKTGSLSESLSFSVIDVGANADVSGEFGFGNSGATGLFDNFISGNTANATPFGGANLDGPAGLNGPQAGLVANTLPIGLGGLGAIQNEWIATLTLTGDPLTNLDFLANLVTIEFGSDAAFITAPEPSSLCLLVAAGVAGLWFLGVTRVVSRMFPGNGASWPSRHPNPQAGRHALGPTSHVRDTT